MKYKQALWRLALALGIAFFGTGVNVQAGSNLVVNGSFDAPDDHLGGWRYVYDAVGESWYTNNHTLVSIVENDNGRKKVLKLHGTRAELWDIGQGVKVDSHPIPVDLSKGKFRFSISARSTGPNCRILIEGFRWAPGVTPHDHPKNTELRKCYKFSQVYFGKQEAGETAALSTAWQKGATVFPEGKLSEQARKNLAQIKFLVVHIVAVDGVDGDLFVDDANIEKIQ